MININTQVPVKQNLTHNGIDTAYSIKEIFNTIQGEGPFAGVPATFIRMGGCNLKCTYCDEDYTTNLEQMFLSDISDRKMEPLIVITGGEPFAQNITPLVNMLLNMDKTVQVETNGTLTCPAFPWAEVTVVVSPKTGKLCSAIEANVLIYKYVIGVDDKDSSDGLPVNSTQGGITTPARPKNKNVATYLMPRDDKDQIKNEANMLTAAHLCMKFGKVLTIQMHKIVGLK